jgi:magnesium transporter
MAFYFSTNLNFSTVPKTILTRQDKLLKIKHLLQYPNAKISVLLSMLHASELAEILEESPLSFQQKIIHHLPLSLSSEAIAEMDEDTHPEKLLRSLHPEVAAELIQELQPDDAAYLLQLMPESEQQKILFHIPQEEESVINQLLAYPEYSAGALMNPEIVKVEADMSRMQAIREIVRLSEEVEDFYIIYVIDEENHLQGYLTFNTLFKSKNHEKIHDIMSRDIVSVFAETEQDEVAKLMSQYNVPSLPVVNQANELIGRITFDDVMDVMEAESTEAILNFAGVSEDENLRGDWANAFKSRIPWLIVNTFTASISGLVLGHFQNIIIQIAILTAYMPVIAGIAGNGATQTLAVTIRRISTSSIVSGSEWKIVLKEISVGAINGIILGAIVSIVAIATNENPLIGLVIFLAMFGNMLIAGLVGSSIPLILEKRNIDPAVASSILITACTDVIGFTLLFGLASWILL